MPAFLEPSLDRVIVEPFKKDTETASGIILPETAEDKPEKGIVVAFKGSWLKVGDAIIFKKYSPAEVEVEGKKFLILDYEDILAKICQEE